MRSGVELGTALSWQEWTQPGHRVAWLRQRAGRSPAVLPSKPCSRGRAVDASSLTRLSTVSTMSLSLTFPICMSPNTTENFIRKLRDPHPGFNHSRREHPPAGARGSLSSAILLLLPPLPPRQPPPPQQPPPQQPPHQQLSR
jgi:hypothetical protein